MSQKTKTIQEIMAERRMKDAKKEYFYYRMNQVWTAFKRLVLIGAIGYGTHWGYKNSSTVKSLLKSHSAPVQEVAHNFHEGMGMIKDTMKNEHSKQAEEYHKIRQKQIQEYRDVGIDPVVRYAESGTKEFADEMDFYRKNGVFGGRE